MTEPNRPRKHKSGDVRCAALNGKGNACGNAADDVIDSQFCLLHDPDRTAERSAYQKSLSEKARAARNAPSLSALAANVPPTRLDSLARVRRMLERVAGEVEMSDEPAVSKANALSRVAAEVRGLLEAGDLEKRIAELERAIEERGEGKR